ncbi:hypothetical protein QFC22_002799 [Naganishia vaughanmartiniae]|uniref:Uncharacterized protein n=1 Tax=Naganishia vaughanmartiniae TaxID=1424756 RepID=A0ACC2XA07_9TREE|nr:hypothetical protein QFC22_002799 [Naganishia vaughanmartiniae]
MATSYAKIVRYRRPPGAADSKGGGSSRKHHTMKIDEEVHPADFEYSIDPKQGSVKGEPWFDHQTAANEALEFPSELNRDFSAQQSFRMKETVVKALLPVITKELLHCVNHGAKRKAHDIASRATCERAGILYDKQDVKQLLTNENASEILFPTVDIETVQPGQQEERNRAQATENITDDMLKSFLTKQSHDSHELPPEAIEEFDSHPFYRIDASKLNEPTFDRMWRDGIPIVIDNAKSYLREDWSPKGFQKLFGDEKCTVYDCQAEIGEDSTINKFFGLFNSRPPDGGAHKVLKLKDWPTTEEFKERCPSLNQDFHNTLPVPDYTRRDGVTNVSAFFPINTNPPDIGPKLYSALRGIETEGGKGTRMHMDIADAINVMTFASERADGKEGCAVWHIYRKQDLEILRAFLREKFSAVHQFVDPVHSQLFYLDATLRQELFVKTGVFAHRIYQYPGQAVMIPAYCAHQVCNHSDCIKIACDFVSPHSITRCAKLTEEFRGENVVSDWKDDVLQLNSMMWYTWLYCSKYDSDHQYAPALPFNEATVGTFIDERTQSRPGQTGEGLARLKPSRPTAGKLLQGQLKKDTESPFWAMPESRPAKAGPLVPPKRSVQLSRPAVPPMTRPVDASQPRAGASSLNTSPESQRPHSTTSVVQAPEPSNIVSQRPHDATIYRTTVSSSILHQPGTTETQNRLDGPHPVSDVTDTTVLTTCTAAPIAGLSA